MRSTSSGAFAGVSSSTSHVPPTSESGVRRHGRGLDVVIVSYRRPDLLQRCLASLGEHPPGCALHARVIDNASGDATTEMVRSEFPMVELIVNPKNRGFAAAANQGIRAGNAQFVLVLNPDCELHEGTLDRLLEIMDTHPDVGICGPALIRPSGEPDHAAKRNFPTPLSSLGHFAGVGRRPRAPAALRGYAAPDLTRGGQVDAVNGAFMLIRRSALEEVGPFDEGYWMYMEDLDLCYRMREASWLTWYEPSVVAIHHKGGSSGPIRSIRLSYAFHYGMHRFYRDHYAPDRNWLVNSAVYVAVAVKLALSVGRDAVRRLRLPE
jgi:N-acetylglucosaminyl-diphospho-decaprenol L-rhamnosyltransferase